MRWRQVRCITSLAVSVLRRSPGLLFMLGLAVLAPGMGAWWQDFNFGSSAGAFVQNFGWGLQNLLGMGVVLAVTLQVQLAFRTDGLSALWRARGVSAGAEVLGQWLFTLGGAFFYALGSSIVVAWAAQGAGAEIGMTPLLVGGVLLSAKLGLVSAICLWFAHWGRGIGFVIVATLGLVLVGHLRPWASEAGGLPMVLSWLAPDFAALGQRPEGDGAVAGELGRLMAMSLAYAAIYLVLASRERFANEG